MSPRRKTGRDVSETDGTDERQRRMSLRRKAKTDGPSVFKSFRLRDILLCHSSGPSQSRRQTPPGRMEPRRITPKTDTPETDGAETEAPETDVPEMEYVRSLRY